LPFLTEIQIRTPAILNELMNIEGLGPKRIQRLYKELGIQSIQDLQKALRTHRIQKLKGFGEKIEAKILNGIKHLVAYQQRKKLADVLPIVDSLLTQIKKFPETEFAQCAGSVRRHKETVGDIDLLVAAKDGKKIIDRLIQLAEITDVISAGTTRASVHYHTGLQIDLRVVPRKSYGAALVYLTGSKEHNIALRQIALKKHLKINEYGVFKAARQIGGATEKEVYKKIGLPLIPPELRENRGEIEIAYAGHLPTLISLNDIRGDLHVHTSATDGSAAIEEMARHAKKMGYEYLAITDHSSHLTIAHGLSEKALISQIKAIDKLNAKLKKFTILKSMEIDILEDGSLDLSKDLLKELDLTVCSIHSKFTLSATKQTERILRAMDNPHFNILAHPTGRLINHREAYALNAEKLMEGAKERGCILEINAQPERLDLNDVHCKMAKEIGTKVVISSDAHSPPQLAYMQFGIYQARRGWLTKENVVNTYPLKKLMKLLKR
jgi:DNA polymerase (family 10)